MFDPGLFYFNINGDTKQDSVKLVAGFWTLHNCMYLNDETEWTPVPECQKWEIKKLQRYGMASWVNNCNIFYFFFLFFFLHLQ